MHAEIKNSIESQPWLAAHYDVGVDYIKGKNGTTFLFRGLRHNISSIKSMAQIDLCIVEEAEDIPHSSWQGLIPTIRAPGSEFWIVLNPKSPASWVAESFINGPFPPRTMSVCINHSDNPYFPPELEEQRKHDQETMPASLYNHIWEGHYLLDDESSIIKADWINAAVDAHLLIPEIAEGTYFLGYDIADDGADKCATVTRKGGLVFDADEWSGREDELLKSTTRAYRSASKYGAHIIYDCIGVGASAGAYIAELNQNQSSANKLRYSKFNAGGKVVKPKAIYEYKTTNEDFFSGAKSQAWWLVADRFRLTYQVVKALREGKEPPKYKADELISICSKTPKLEQIKMELATPHREFDNNGKVKVESKKDLAKREVPSPNMADAFIMAYAPVSGSMTINPEALR